MSDVVKNWAGNITFNASRIHRMLTVPELQDLVAGGGKVRVLGSGHSFNRMADTTGDLVDLIGLPRVVEISADRRTVRVDGGIRYGELADRLHAEGLAVHNMASLPHISVAGAVTTATHGSGVRNRNLATSVAGLELIRGDGKLVTLRRGDEGFDGAVVGLGALGIVTALTLDVVPAFEIRQYVYDDLPRSVLDDNLPEILASGYSVSLFTNWQSTDINHAWLKRTEPMPDGPFFGARPADGPRHPVPGVDATNSTEQFGVPGPWHARLPHFRMEFSPSTGAELQSEWMVPLDRALEAIDAVAAIREQLAPVLQVNEIRTVAADDLWLSMNYHRDSLGLHFTWIADTDRVLPVVAALEEQLAPLEARPHWGKVFTQDPATIRSRYERFADFQALAAEYDPAGTFRNAWLDDILG
ncbi:D-arabinono-1,4-lactone oxidase [Actinoplanes friuliensis]|uniref:Putative FAD-dependent oxidoreductase n=1 Tax=Actinoplanes friuliensis DSM 7358 TaxID=1246995 RepID=U5W235_9ACTN|nr:D-arabinono-1,4-lactone oxidase [Actinoplanes friuliensis]AGZ43293.1 putative FAD-dependent oxidoreductase [Actinoplanes friuliensis DSM 7358]